MVGILHFSTLFSILLIFFSSCSRPMLSQAQLKQTSDETAFDPKGGIIFDSSTLSGPWPKCKGVTLQACLDMIMVDAPDVTPLVLHPGEGATREYNIFRVIIHVDESDIVTNIPNRG